MKHIFETEDQIEATRIIKSLDIVLCLDQILGHIYTKHIKRNETYTEQQLEVAENILKDINKIIDDHNINLDELLN